MMPFSDDLRTAENRLNDARSRIMLASSQEQVADEFDGMMLAGLDNDRAAHVNIGSGGCDYSTGELIAIAIGLILGDYSWVDPVGCALLVKLIQCARLVVKLTFIINVFLFVPSK